MSELDTFHTEGHDDITGLVLSGGGARAAYQVGVLHQLAKWFEQENKREFDFPFKILCGTSAGAINAAALACAFTWSGYSLQSRRYGEVPTDVVTFF